MVAAVEQFGKMAAFASFREVAWHQLGTVFKKPVTTPKMLELSHLANWNMRFVDAAEAMKGFDFVKPTLHVVRDNPFEPTKKDVLGTVGGRYRIFSNEEIFDFGDALTNQRRRWETAGSINGGTVVFATLVATDDLVLDPNGSGDKIRKYILLTSSHDGSSTMIAKKVNTRVVCQNTLNVALGEHGESFKIRHTEGMTTKIEDAKRALGFADEYDAIFEAEAKALFAAKTTDAKFWSMVEQMFPKPEKDVKGSLAKWSTKTDRLMDVWNNSTGSMENLPKNKWRAFQAFTEDNQWNRPVRAGNTENFFSAGAGFDGATNAFRNKTLELVKSF